MRMILDSVVSDAGRVERNSMVPSSLIVPAKTSEPDPLAMEADSPVMGAWFTEVAPRVITPSSGIRSPGRTTTVAPTGISSNGFFLDFPIIGAYEAGFRRGDIQKCGYFAFGLAQAP